MAKHLKRKIFAALSTAELALDTGELRWFLKDVAGAVEKQFWDLRPDKPQAPATVLELLSSDRPSVLLGYIYLRDPAPGQQFNYCERPMKHDKRGNLVYLDPTWSIKVKIKKKATRLVAVTRHQPVCILEHLPGFMLELPPTSAPESETGGRV